MSIVIVFFFFFFFNDTATTEIYTLSLHDALPISESCEYLFYSLYLLDTNGYLLDRKSTRLNSSHQIISYAVFCLKKKNQRKRVNNEKRISKCATRTAAGRGVS